MCMTYMRIEYVGYETLMISMTKNWVPRVGGDFSNHRKVKGVSFAKTVRGKRRSKYGKYLLAC